MMMPATFLKGFHNEGEVTKMTYSELGKTGLNLSRLGLGGGAMSGFYNEFDEKEAVETVIEAVKSGINYIDTAPYYGQGRSETVIGKALRELPRETYYISTKVGRYSSEWATMFDYSSNRITQSLEHSLQLLSIDYVDILIVHDIEFANLDQIINETLPAIEELVKKGKVRFIGVSGYPIGLLWDAVCKSHVKIDVVLSYCRDTLIDKSLHKFFPLFKEKGVGLINAAPTSMSMLTNVGPQDWHPASSQIKEICAKASNLCKKEGIELGKLATFHCLQTREIVNLLVGMNNRNILRMNLSLLSDGLTEKETNILNEIRSKILPKEDLQWEGVEEEKYKKFMRDHS